MGLREIERKPSANELTPVTLSLYLSTSHLRSSVSDTAISCQVNTLFKVS